MAFDRLLADLRGMQDAPPEEDRFARDQGMEEFLLRQYGNRAAPEVAAETGAKSGSREGGSYLAMAARLGAPIAGSVLGALSPVPGGAYLGGAVGSAAGEAVGEWLDGQPLDPQEITLQGVVGGIPFAGKASSIAGGALLRGAEGAALGAGSELAREALHRQAPDTGAILRGAALGGAFGAVGGGVEGYFAARAARAAQDGADVVTDLAHQRAAQHEAIDQAYQQTTDELLGTLPPADRALYDAYREGRLTLVKPDGTPLDEELFARLEPIRQQHEEATQAWEAAKGWLPEQQGAARAANSPDPQAAFEEGAKEAEQAQLRRRVVTDRTPGDAAADTAFEQADHQRQIAADARAVAQVAEHVEPSLGQLGLPGPGETAGALSAADPEHLAPSIIDHINAPEDIKSVLNNLAAQAQTRDRVAYARRGVQTREQRLAAARPIVAELSDRLGLDPDRFQATLLKRGEAVNPEQMEAVKITLTDAARDFSIAAKRVAANPDDKEAMLMGWKAQAIGRSLVAAKASGAAEAARVLNALRKAEQQHLQGAAFEKILKEGGTSPQALKDMFAKAAVLDDPVEMERFMHAGPTWGDMLNEGFLSSVLSGPKTFIRNMLGNTTALGIRPLEEVGAAALDPLRAAVTGTKRERFLGEAVADVVGMSRGLVGGSRIALRALTGNTLDWARASLTRTPRTRRLAEDLMDVDGAIPKALRAFATEQPSVFQGGEKAYSNRRAWPGQTGRVVRLPLRGLLAADEFFKALSAEGSVYAQAYREAAQEGAKGNVRLDRMAQLIAEERPRLHADAKGEALYRTFQSDTSEIPKALVYARNKIPGARYVVPFISTIYNIAGFGLERTPLGAIGLAKRAIEGDLTHAQAVDKVARLVIGTGLAGAVVAAVGEGGITGSEPLNPGERNALRGTGWQRDSLKLGNEYFSYANMDPISTMLGTTADAVQLFHDPLVAPDDVVARLAFGFARRISDQPFLSGMKDLLEARENPTQLTGYLKRMALTAIPNAVAQVSRGLDPTVRRHDKTLTGMAQERSPWSTSMLPMRNLWGEPIVRQGGTAERVLSPIQRSPIAQDPASNEVRRLALGVGLGIGAPSLTIQEDGVTTPMEPKDYDRLSVHAGQIAKAKVTALVRSPGYAKLDDQKRADLIDAKFREAREEARDALKITLAMRKRRR